ncbi:hypothetical protein GCM10010964_07040 [Caldovatus sediminis]|uniref:Uncharacterized protein n=1 Tax=Caldovatus sediminis TaxID=2041189 RepID=A0A8J2Z868_9PROT|nr:hypothetical protein GCM10010964_07040 [Caldovatus sediminis]
MGGFHSGAQGGSGARGWSLALAAAPRGHRLRPPRSDAARIGVRGAALFDLGDRREAGWPIPLRSVPAYPRPRESFATARSSSASEYGLCTTGSSRAAAPA